MKIRIDLCRRDINEISIQVKSEIKHGIPLNWPNNADIGEFNANIMLAYRHLEDARMRLGKALQALDGGVSVYDK